MSDDTKTTDMHWYEALIWCVTHPSWIVRDKDGGAHVVSMDSGAPNLRCEGWRSRPFDPACEPYSVDTKQTTE